MKRALEESKTRENGLEVRAEAAERKTKRFKKAIKRFLEDRAGESSEAESTAYECALTSACAETGAVIRRSPHSRALRVTRGPK